MTIRLMQTADGRTTYVFGIILISQLMNMEEDQRAFNISEHAHIWVSENEGYNSIECDHMVEELEEALSLEVERCLEFDRQRFADLQAKYPDRDFAHEADMEELRREQLDRDIDDEPNHEPEAYR